MPIQDLKTVRLQVALGDTRAVRAVRMHVDLERSWIGGLTVKLEPPAGTGVSAVVPHDGEEGGAHTIHRIYDIASTPVLGRLGGKAATGIWKLEGQDGAKRDVGQNLGFALELEL